jgi:hypothetical protein
MSRKSDKRKDAKRKKRQASMKQSKQRANESRAKARQARKAFHDAHKEAFKAQDRLEAENLLDVIELPNNSRNRAAALAFTNQCVDFVDQQSSLSGGIDELFALAHGVSSRKFSAMTEAQILRVIIKGMRKTMKGFERRVEALFSTEVGKRVYATDDLEGRMMIACEERRDELIELDRRLSECHQWIDASESDEDDNPDINFFVAAQNQTDTVTVPIERIERYRLGVPRDFFTDVVDTLSSVGMNSAVFYLRRLYLSMMAKDFPGKGMRDEPLEIFKAALNVAPDKVLPDPDILKELKEATLRFSKIGKNIAGTVLYDAYVSLRREGLSLDEAMGKLERLPSHGEVSFVLSHLESEGHRDLERFLDHPEFFEAFVAIRKVEKDLSAITRFLNDYGDYPINGSSVAGTMVENRNNTALNKLIMDNALYLCCDESSGSMMRALADEKNETVALRQYIRFGSSEEPFKQLALLKYVTERGTGRLREFVSTLDGYDDLSVGELLMEENCIPLLLAGYRPGTEDALHRLKEMANFDLVMQYNIAPEIHKLGQDDLSKVDEAISAIRGTKYEAVLLGQPSLRRKALERLLQGELSLDDLPENGNMYLILRERIAPAEAESQPERAATEYDRIILISDRTGQDTVDFLSERSGCAVNLLSVSSSPHRFDGIREGDLVLYDTTKSGHSTYYLVKNLAVRRGAQFLHASRTNKEALLELIG